MSSPFSPSLAYLPTITDSLPLVTVRPDDYKLKVYIRIVRLFLEEEDSTSADTYFNRASLLAHSAQDLETQLQFKLCQARMFDFSRRFAEAASKYHEISYVSALAEDERLQALYVRPSLYV